MNYDFADTLFQVLRSPMELCQATSAGPSIVVRAIKANGGQTVAVEDPQRRQKHLPDLETTGTGEWDGAGRVTPLATANLAHWSMRW